MLLSDFKGVIVSLPLNFNTIHHMKVGDKVLISPDVTRLNNWIEGTVIEIEHNPFVGVVISAETNDGDVFFGQSDLFKKQLEEEICLQ